MRDFLENHLMIKIAPLDAFFGDCKGNILTRYKVTEKIRYLDVCALTENECISDRPS